MKHYTANKQHITKRENQETILAALKEGPKRFKDLDNAVEFSQTTLANGLNDLENEGLIEKTIHNGEPAYTLTKKGEYVYDKIFFLIHTLNQIKQQDGNYVSGGVPVQKSIEEPFFWPTQAHLAVDKTIDDILQIIPKEYLIRLQLIIFANMLENMKRNNLEIDENKKGSIVLGIEIDYSDLARAYKENSLEKWKQYWNKEKTIETLWTQDSLSKGKKLRIIQHLIKGNPI